MWWPETWLALQRGASRCSLNATDAFQTATMQQMGTCKAQAVDARGFGGWDEEGDEQRRKYAIGQGGFL